MLKFPFFDRPSSAEKEERSANARSMAKFDFFDRLSPTIQEELLTHAKSMTIPKGVELFNQGDHCDDILFLTEGSVRVYRLHESGQEITLYFLEPMEQCNVNLNSAFTNTPAIGTAVCESEITGFMLPAPIIKKLYTSQPVYQQFVFDLFARRLEGLAGLIEDVRFEKLDHRLMNWLEEQEENPVKITHEKLASHLGTSREVISRLLKEFEHNGIVSLHRGKIEIVL